MSSELHFDLPLPMLPVTTGVYQSNHNYEFEIAPQDYLEKIFAYARKYTNNQVVLVYPKNENGETDANCPVYDVGTVIRMHVCEPVVRKGELWSYSIETTDTQKANIIACGAKDGVRLAICTPYRERNVELSLGQKMMLLLPIWISIRANVGGNDSIHTVLPCMGNEAYAFYLRDIDGALQRVCRYLPLDFSQRAAYFAAPDVLRRCALVLEFLNKAHASGFRMEIVKADLRELGHWHRGILSGLAK